MEEPLYFYTKTMPFWGLSNFAPPGVESHGRFWPTVEHFFQAQKFEAAEIQELIRRAPSPKEARALGQSSAYPLRENWASLRQEVMLQGLRIKFSSPSARDLLLSTGKRHLVESSPF